MRFALVALISSGCLAGGGAVVGVGAKHGAFAGVELNGGTVVNAAVGYDSRQRMYARVDAVLDGLMDQSSNANLTQPVDRLAGGGRIGVGIGKLDDDALLVIAAGPYGGVALTHAYCDEPVWDAQLAVEVRYLGEWQLALVPRLEYEDASCIGGK